MIPNTSLRTDGSAADLDTLLDEVRQAEAHLARAVLLAGRLAGSGVAERVEGVPLELLLGLACRLTGADRRMLVAAGETLASLPTVAQLFAEGKLSWGQVRAIVAAAKRLSVEARAELDARIAATAAAHDGVDGFDPDQLLWAVDESAEELRSPRSVERFEARRAARSFVAVQAGLDGGLRLYGELDPVSGATVLGTLDAAAGQPAPEGDDADADTGDDAPTGAWSPTSRGRQYAQALTDICAGYLGGDPKTGRRARPLLIAHVNLADLICSAAAKIELGVRGPLATVTLASLERLTKDADLRAVLFDGARPLAVSAKVSAEDIPARTRIAVRARDLGCRFPGSHDPIGHTDLHHIRWESHGGDHHPDKLVALSRRFHTLVHHRGWRLTLDTDTGELTITRRGRRWRSLPRGTPLARAPERPPPDRPNPSRSTPPCPSDFG